MLYLLWKFRIIKGGETDGIKIQNWYFGSAQGKRLFFLHFCNPWVPKGRVIVHKKLSAVSWTDLGAFEAIFAVFCARENCSPKHLILWTPPHPFRERKFFWKNFQNARPSLPPRVDLISNHDFQGCDRQNTFVTLTKMTKITKKAASRPSPLFVGSERLAAFYFHSLKMSSSARSSAVFKLFYRMWSTSVSSADFFFFCFSLSFWLI